MRQNQSLVHLYSAWDSKCISNINIKYDVCCTTKRNKKCHGRSEQLLLLMQSWRLDEMWAVWRRGSVQVEEISQM